MNRNMMIALIIALIVLLYAGHRTNFFGFRSKTEMKEVHHEERHALREKQHEEREALAEKQEHEANEFAEEHLH